MTTRPDSRKLLVVGTSAALLLGAVGFVPLLGSASAAACASWTDPKGDSITGIEGEKDPTGLATDANLDIVSSSLGTVGTALVGTIVTDGLNEGSSDAGDEFGFQLTVAGVALQIYADRTVAVLPGAGKVTVLDDAGILGPNEVGSGTATYDVAKKTVTINIPLTEVAIAAEKPVTGQAATKISSYTMDQVPLVVFGQPLFEYDESATPQTTVIGEACGGGGGTPPASGTPTATATATASASASPSASPTTPPPAGEMVLLEQPRAGCVLFPDAAGDADPTPAQGQGNEPSLDVTAVNVRSPQGQVQFFVKLTNAAAAMRPFWTTRIYNVAFTVGGKAVTLEAGADGPAVATVAGAANTTIKATAKITAAANNIVFTVPIDQLGAAVGTPVAAGSAFTAMTVTTSAKNQVTTRAADSATGTTDAQKTYAYGDNTCFLPPPGIVTIEADPSAQFTDATVLFATLTDETETPVVGASLSAKLPGGASVSAVTDEDGVAEITLPITVPAGAAPITAAFAGNADVGAASATAPFTVLVEKTVLKATGTRGGASATLKDDDGKAVAGQFVLFTVGSKKYSVKTSATGVAVLSKIAKGTSIKVGFAAVAGKYAATPTYTVKAL